MIRPSTQNEVTGKIHQVKGTIKEKLGQLTDNPKLEIEGTAENLAGHLQDKFGQVQKVVEKP
jgi:uncharacterized protein YjbJ (UPF0337 family)